MKSILKDKNIKNDIIEASVSSALVIIILIFIKIR